MNDFQAILVEGLFYEHTDNGELFIERDDGVHVSWMSVIEPVLGQHIQLALHHLPPNGLELGKPGAGSCRWPDGVGCPVRHDLSPDRLLSFHMEGVLTEGHKLVSGADGPNWTMMGFDGIRKEVPLRGMPGHYGRVGAASLMDVEKMREALMGVSSEALAASGVNVTDLEAMLDRLRKAGT